METDKTNTSPYRPRYEQIAEDLVAFMLAANFQAGDRLPTEAELGERFGVSRAVVHDAVKLLTASGMVRPRRGSGLFVGTLEPAAESAGQSRLAAPERMQELFEFRSDIEQRAVVLAIARISVVELRQLEQILRQNQAEADTNNQEAFLLSDLRFHEAIAAATHNAFYAETVTMIMQSQRWAVRLLTGGAPGSNQESAMQHAAILAALKAGETENAMVAVRTHVESVFRAYQAAVHRTLLNEAQLHTNTEK